MPSHAYTQHDRDLLVASLLDISLDQFFEGIEVIGDLEESDPVNVLGGQYVHNMQERDGQMMFQATTQMSDETLHRFVWAFGTNPLDFDPPLVPSEEMRLGVVFEDADGEELIVTPFPSALVADEWAKERLGATFPNAPVKYFVTPVATPKEYDEGIPTE
jgi:hypothetical protein